MNLPYGSYFIEFMQPIKKLKPFKFNFKRKKATERIFCDKKYMYMQTNRFYQAVPLLGSGTRPSRKSRKFYGIVLFLSYCPASSDSKLHSMLVPRHSTLAFPIAKVRTVLTESGLYTLLSPSPINAFESFTIAGNSLVKVYTRVWNYALVSTFLFYTDAGTY